MSVGKECKSIFKADMITSSSPYTRSTSKISESLSRLVVSMIRSVMRLV